MDSLQVVEGTVAALSDPHDVVDLDLRGDPFVGPVAVRACDGQLGPRSGVVCLWQTRELQQP